MFDTASEFVSAAPSAAIWPHSLPNGTKLRRATILLPTIGLGSTLLAQFEDGDGRPMFEWSATTLQPSPLDAAPQKRDPQLSVTRLPQVGTVIEWRFCSHLMRMVVYGESSMTEDQAVGAAESSFEPC